MMPSGAYVKAVHHQWYLDVYVYAIPEDKEKMTGFCGNFDENSNNDLTWNPEKPGAASLIESWR